VTLNNIVRNQGIWRQQRLTLGGVISGASQLIKNGTANLTLNGANTSAGAPRSTPAA
jgi:hypothetical protein